MNAVGQAPCVMSVCSMCSIYSTHSMFRVRTVQYAAVCTAQCSTHGMCSIDSLGMYSTVQCEQQFAVCTVCTFCTVVQCVQYV